MSRRKRTSCWPPSRIIGLGLPADVLAELDAVSVQVDDLEQAHLAVQFEHDPHLAPLGAQARGLRLHVVDLDVRDAALLRLAGGQRDLHPAPLELRPTVVRVEHQLGEAKPVAIETARGVEVPHRVPDGQSARPGSSRNAFTSSRNRALSAPSTVRWSHVSVSVIIGRTTTSPSRATGRSSTEPTARIAAWGGFST